MLRLNMLKNLNIAVCEENFLLFGPLKFRGRIKRATVPARFSFNLRALTSTSCESQHFNLVLIVTRQQIHCSRTTRLHCLSLLT